MMEDQAMIASMTAFARQTKTTSFGSLVWEIRSVNHRYLEVSLRLPDFLNPLESPIRDQIHRQLHRGKVDAVLRFQSGMKVSFQLVANRTLIAQLAKASESALEFFPTASINMMDVLSWPGVLETPEQPMDEITQDVLTLLKATLDDVVQSRRREGEGIQQFLLERLSNLQKGTTNIKKRVPELMDVTRQKIKSRFEELSLSVEQERLEQEMVWLIQKMDVSEELQRLEAHQIEVQRILEQGGVVGRRLDFLMQELNREANTLSSKSWDADVTQIAVELKVQIEQMREQVQNLE